MSSVPRKSHLAVLIDADNISHHIVSQLFADIAKIGKASVRRIYGDFSHSRLDSWSKILSTFAIMPHQNCASMAGKNAVTNAPKNASDIALVIDAMDLLHSGRFDGFCLVSSDSDFTRLAIRIREQGIDVYGFGAQKTPESFRNACCGFVCLKDASPKDPVPEAKKASAKSRAITRKSPTEAVPLILKAIKQSATAEGWARVSDVERKLASLPTKFDPSTYGQSTLIDIVKKTNVFELRENDREIRKKVENGVASATAKKPKGAAD